jgi:hypothetical protein
MKQIKINIHKGNNTKTQYEQYKYNKFKYTYYQNTHTYTHPDLTLDPFK